jgi:hypothetical protein
LDDHDLLIRIDERVEAIHRAIYGGNNAPGLLERVDKLEAWRNRILGGLSILSFIILAILAGR